MSLMFFLIKSLIQLHFLLSISTLFDDAFLVTLIGSDFLRLILSFAIEYQGTDTHWNGFMDQFFKAVVFKAIRAVSNIAKDPIQFLPMLHFSGID